LSDQGCGAKQSPTGHEQPKRRRHGYGVAHKKAVVSAATGEIGAKTTTSMRRTRRETALMETSPASIAGISVPLGRYPEGPPSAGQLPLRPVDAGPTAKPLRSELPPQLALRSAIVC